MEVSVLLEKLRATPRATFVKYIFRYGLLAGSAVLVYWIWTHRSEPPLIGMFTEPKQSEIVRNAAIVAFGVAGILFALVRVYYMEGQRSIAQSSNRFDRYQKAAAMLAEESASVRQAAIYSLTAIAEEDQQHFSQMVEKLLASYIREQSAAKVLRYREYNKDIPTERPALKTETDVADAFKALVQIAQKNRWARLWSDLPMIDLSESYLPNSGMAHPNLTGFDFSRAIFTAISFDGVTFQNCRFYETEFLGACFSNVKFRSCYFWRTNLNGAKIRKTDFTECEIEDLKYRNVLFKDVSENGNPVQPEEVFGLPSRSEANR